RHTTSKRDCSSDVCSSDLIGESCAKKISDNVDMKAKRFHETNADVGELYNYYGLYLNLIVSEKGESLQGVKSSSNEEVEWSKVKIGRASCREGGWRSAVAV